MVNQFSGVSLRSTGQGWEFASEQALEDFVWSQLEALLKLRPFQRQYGVMGEFCDILALTEDGQLAILELKNTEDRYVVQQLTRYYANLLEERPFPDAIDYDKPVRLMAIAPTFHRHNYIDRQYSRLDFEFIQVVVFEEERFFLELQFEAQPPVRTVLPYQELDLDSHPEDLGPVPDLLLKWLGACSPADQQAFLQTRQQILRFHPRMQEMVGARAIQYGTGQTKLCAEICFERSRQRPVLFLWLPLPSFRGKPGKPERLGRLRLWLQDGALTHVGHVTEGLGKMRLREEWAALPKSKWPRQNLVESLTNKSMVPVQAQPYIRSCLGDESGTADLNQVVGVALQKWLGKL